MKITLKNLLKNSNFSDASNWDNANINVSHGFIGTTSLHCLSTTIVTQLIDRCDDAHKYYLACYAKSLVQNDNDTIPSISFKSGNAYIKDKDKHKIELKLDTLTSNWKRVSDMYELSFNNNTNKICISPSDSDTYIDAIMLIDLTECFGNEAIPTKEVLDAIPYFEDTYEFENTKTVSIYNHYDFPKDSITNLYYSNNINVEFIFGIKNFNIEYNNNAPNENKAKLVVTEWYKNYDEISKSPHSVNFEKTDVEDDRYNDYSILYITNENNEKITIGTQKIYYWNGINEDNKCYFNKDSITGYDGDVALFNVILPMEEENGNVKAVAHQFQVIADDEISGINEQEYAFFNWRSTNQYTTATCNLGLYAPIGTGEDQKIQSINNSKITLKGTIDGYLYSPSTVYVYNNGILINKADVDYKFDEISTFSKEVFLMPGENNIKIIVRDICNRDLTDETAIIYSSDPPASTLSDLLTNFIANDGDKIELHIGNSKLKYSDENAGINKLLTYTGNTLSHFFEITGENAEYYRIDNSNPPNIRASIVKRPLIVTYNPVEKIYDGSLDITDALKKHTFNNGYYFSEVTKHYRDYLNPGFVRGTQIVRSIDSIIQYKDEELVNYDIYISNIDFTTFKLNIDNSLFVYDRTENYIYYREISDDDIIYNFDTLEYNGNRIYLKLENKPTLDITSIPKITMSDSNKLLNGTYKLTDALTWKINDSIKYFSDLQGMIFYGTISDTPTIYGTTKIYKTNIFDWREKDAYGNYILRITEIINASKSSVEDDINKLLNSYYETYSNIYIEENPVTLESKIIYEPLYLYSYSKSLIRSTQTSSTEYSVIIPGVNQITINEKTGKESIDNLPYVKHYNLNYEEVGYVVQNKKFIKAYKLIGSADDIHNYLQLIKTYKGYEFLESLNVKNDYNEETNTKIMIDIFDLVAPHPYVVKNKVSIKYNYNDPLDTNQNFVLVESDENTVNAGFNSATFDSGTVSDKWIPINIKGLSLIPGTLGDNSNNYEIVNYVAYGKILPKDILVTITPLDKIYDGSDKVPFDYVIDGLITKEFPNLTNSNNESMLTVDDVYVDNTYYGDRMSNEHYFTLTGSYWLEYKSNGNVLLDKDKNEIAQEVDVDTLRSSLVLYGQDVPNYNLSNIYFTTNKATIFKREIQVEITFLGYSISKNEFTINYQFINDIKYDNLHLNLSKLKFYGGTNTDSKINLAKLSDEELINEKQLNEIFFTFVPNKIENLDIAGENNNLYKDLTNTQDDLITKWTISEKIPVSNILERTDVIAEYEYNDSGKQIVIKDNIENHYYESKNRDYRFSNGDEVKITNIELDTSNIATNNYILKASSQILKLYIY